MPLLPHWPQPAPRGSCWEVILSSGERTATSPGSGTDSLRAAVGVLGTLPAMRPPPPAAALTGFAAEVLELVEQIPPGRVCSYGDIAAMIGRAGPRQVGQVLAGSGGRVCWWRVIYADGSPPPLYAPECRARWKEEDTPLLGEPGAERADMKRARWEPS